MARKQPQMSSKDAGLFMVMNDQWQIKETSPGLYELSARDGSSQLVPMPGLKLVGVLAVISELDRHLAGGEISA